MRDFSWKYFSMTGDVDAYLLYKEMDNELHTTEDNSEEDPGTEASDGIQ
ncbi:YqzL family protein [Paenibacillus sp. UNC451MF]|nr:YqzL family protein [Paenibacillus sp. UNC451MF]